MAPRRAVVREKGKCLGEEDEVEHMRSSLLLLPRQDKADQEREKRKKQRAPEEEDEVWNT